MPFQRTVLAALTLSFCGWAFAQDDTEARHLLDAGRTEEAIGAYTRLLSSSPRLAAAAGHRPFAQPAMARGH